MEYEHSEHVAAAPDRLYALLAHVGNLPHFVPQLTAVHQIEGEKVEVEARYEGHSQRGEAWFRTDAEDRRIEWGVEVSGYHGSFQVAPDGDGSRLILGLTTTHERDLERDVSGTLDAVRRLLEAEA